MPPKESSFTYVASEKPKTFPTIWLMAAKHSEIVKLMVDLSFLRCRGSRFLIIGAYFIKVGRSTTNWNARETVLDFKCRNSSSLGIISLLVLPRSSC